jgi:hypothetical protein
VPPFKEESRTFKAPVDEVRDAASDALASLGAKIEESEDRMSLVGTTGWTLFSFGEKVQVTLQSRKDGVHVTVHSTQRVRIALADLGKRNQKNVGSVLNAMATRLSS